MFYLSNRFIGAFRCKLIVIIALPISGLIACSNSDDDDALDIIDQVPTVAPIESVVKTAVPLAYAASISMDSVNGTVFGNVSRSNTCSSYPCAASLVITVEPDSLPVTLSGISDNGEILVVGLFSSATQAIMTVVFDDIDAGNDFLSVRKISTIPVTRLNNITTLTYSNIDIDISTDPEDAISLNDTEIQNEYDRLDQDIDTGPEVNVTLDAWIVEADTRGTTSDVSDDEFRVVGGGQYFEVGPDDVSVLQMGVINMVVTPDCALNPTSGLSVLQEVRVSTGDRSTWPVLGQALIEFESDCTGSAHVILGTGSFLLASGDDIDLGFSD